MGRLTKAGFASSKRALGLIGKLTRKQVQRVFKHAIKKLGRKLPGKMRRSKRTRTSNPRKTTKKVKRRMGRRKKRRRGGKSMTRTAFKLIRLGALVGGGAAEASQYGPMQDKLIGGLLSYGGYHWGQKRFDMAVALRVWTPYLMASVFTHGIPKLTSIIRRL